MLVGVEGVALARAVLAISAVLTTTPWVPEAGAVRSPLVEPDLGPNLTKCFTPALWRRPTGPGSCSPHLAIIALVIIVELPQRAPTTLLSRPVSPRPPHLLALVLAFSCARSPSTAPSSPAAPTITDAPTSTPVPHAVAEREAREFSTDESARAVADIDSAPLPPEDSDDDGVPDPIDACPTLPESRNGYEDADGCPDAIPKEIHAALKTYQYNVNEVNRLLDKSEMSEGLKRALRRVATIMRRYPEIRIEIIGHTNSPEVGEYGQTPNGRMTAKMKKFLIEDEQIAETRLKSISEGPIERIASTKTPEGRAKNRRIEFRLLAD